MKKAPFLKEHMLVFAFRQQHTARTDAEECFEAVRLLMGTGCPGYACVGAVL